MVTTKKQNDNVVFSFNGRPTKPKPRGPLDARLLKEAGEFNIVFLDGKAVKVTLIELGNYNLLVKSGANTLLVPKHSIKYILLQ